MRAASALSRFSGDPSGNVAMIFALSAALLLAAGGGAVDFMRMGAERASMQEAADAAALAAARLLHRSEADRNRAAQKLFARNFADLPAEERPRLQLSYSGETVTASASRAMPTTLLAVIGKPALDVSVTSAAAKASSSPVCILALDTSAPNGFEIYGNASLVANHCAAASNSRDHRGMRLYGAATASASEFGVVGGYEGDFAPQPQTGIAPLVDPYRDLRLPTPGACAGVGSLKRGTFTLDPGAYCGGIDIGSGAVVRLNPGLYIVQEGEFRVQAGARVEGDGVTIAFVGKGATLFLQGGAQLSLKAPDTGAFKGIVLFSESTSPHVEWLTVSGGATLEYEGTLYLPTHEIWLKSPATDDAVLKAKTTEYGLIAKRIWVQGRASLEVTRDADAGDKGLRFKYGSRLVR